MSLFRAFMVETLHLRKLTGTNSRGDATHGDAVAHPCQVDRSARVVKTVDGRTAQASLTLRTTAEVATGDLVYPPGADTSDVGRSRKPMQVNTHRVLGSARVDHWEVVL